MRRSKWLELIPGVLGTILWHWRLIASGLDRIPGDLGDARSTIYQTEHWYHVFRGQAEALSPGIFYPVKETIGYSEIMPLHAIPYSVLRLAGLDMFSAFAVPLILFTFLNYVACFLLLRRVLGQAAIPSIAGAMFFAFNSPRLNQAGHLPYQLAFLLPVIAACAVRFVQQRKSLSQLGAFALLATGSLSLALQFLILPYQGWFVVFWLCLFTLVVLAMPSARRVLIATVRKFAPAIVAGFTVLLIGLIPFFIVYSPVRASAGPRSYPEAFELTPDGWSLIEMGNRNFIWGRMAASLSRVHPLFSTELNIGIGLVPSLVMLMLIVWAARTLMRDFREHQVKVADSRPFVLAAMILATALSYAIGMRYGNTMSPWHVVYNYVPGANGLRAISRYVLVLALPMAIAFATVMNRGLQIIAAYPSPRRRQLITALVVFIAAFGLAEQFGRVPAFSARAELARLQRIAASLPDNCNVFYAAASPGRTPGKHEDQIDAMLISSMRGIPTVNGYAGHVPPGWTLREVDAPDYEQRVARWISSHHVTGRVCRLEIPD